MKILFVALIVFSLAWTGLSITKEMKRFELFCTYKTLSAGDFFFGTYVVSGFNEKGMAFQLFSPSNHMLEKIEYEREGSFNLNVTEAGEYRVCFRNLEKDLAYVSFIIYGMNNDFMHTPEKSTQEEINEMAGELKTAVKLVRAIKTNLGYQEFRDRVHTTNLGILASRINWSTFFKVLVLAGIGAGQFIVLTNFFKKKFNRVSV